jgi:hypothetical protein
MFVSELNNFSLEETTQLLKKKLLVAELNIPALSQRTPE